jgi:IS5 family transposase
MLIISYPRDPDFAARWPGGFKLNPQLAQIDELLNDRKLILLATNDLALSAPQALWNGRPSTPVVVTLRTAVARRLKDWSYRSAEEEINGSMQWRVFCALADHRCPDHSTLQDREKLIRPATLHRINDRVVRLGQQHGVSAGRKLRGDGSVTETNIHYPSDSSLLADSTRVLGRCLRTARDILKPRSARQKLWLRDGHRQAAHLARRIGQQLRGRRGEKSLTNKAKRDYRQLVRLTARTVQHAWQVHPLLVAAGSSQARMLAASLAHYLPLVQIVIHQTTRRVLNAEQVPAAEKIVSLFEPHTAIIQRGKARPHETEFGRKVWYSESDGGLITRYALLQGNPPETNQWLPSIRQHAKLFGHPPDEATADRGVFSEDNVQQAKGLGVKRVALPKPGAKSRAQQRHESQPWFKAVLRWRNGIEGRISQLRRARGLDRCLNHGESGMERWLGWGVVANNLMVMARTLTQRRRKSRRPAK